MATTTTRKIQVHVEFLPDDHAAFKRAVGLLGFSMAEWISRQARRFTREVKNSPQYAHLFEIQPLTADEETALHLIDLGAWDLLEIAKELDKGKKETLRVLEGLAEKGHIERRKRAKTDAARGKQPEIWVRVGEV
jgi:hypothetical protein